MNFAEIIVVMLICGIASMGFIFPKSKKVFYLEMIFLTLMLAMYNGKIDLLFYESEYEKHILSSSIFEKGYEYISIAFSSFNVSFFTYKFIMVALSMTVFGYVIQKASKRVALSASLLYGFATFEYAWQLKALCSSAILVYALYSLICNAGRKGNRIKFCILVLIASEFHFFALMFLPMVLIDCKNKKRIKLFIVSITFFLSVCIHILMEYLRQYIPALMTYANLLSVKTFFLSSLWQVAGVFLIFLVYCHIVIKQKSNRGRIFTEFVKNETKLISGIYMASMISLIVIPFYWYTNVISRMVRVMFIFYGIALSYIKSYEFGAQIYKFGMVLYMSSSFILFYVMFRDSHFGLVKDFLNNNLLFQFCM